MKLILKRTVKKEKYTLGKLYIDDKYFCDTLEDKDRNLDKTMSLNTIKRLKIAGETAIPTGTYKILTNVISPKFKKRAWAAKYGGCVPRLNNVPGFDGVLIHPGNTAEDTLGCILLGENKIVGQVINSQKTFDKFMQKIKGAENIELEIK